MAASWNRLGRALIALLVLALAACSDGGPAEISRPSVESSPTPAPSEAANSPVPETPAQSVDDDGFSYARNEMVEQHIHRLGVKDERVLQAIRDVPRHRFVPESQIGRAYADRPLPIGFGQTISQPYVVALMTELLDVKSGDKVLEIGTGSGYQSAVLARLTDQVWSIEIIPELARRAASTLDALGYKVKVKQADGYFGWPEEGPFDGIIVTAAPDHMPQPLIKQLAEGGKLIVPVGPPGSYQTLWRVTKRDGKIVSENITDVIFVPLVRDRD
jgi:protein-L-isoaspartate(D-aspartate) O-methyltransferase